MKCVSCLQGTNWECRQGGQCDDGQPATIVSNLSELKESELIGENVEDNFKTYKDDSALRDQQSTGRKRAAKMYPLERSADCEWKMQKNCGGGVIPIIGCNDGKQEARHHGPDKNTLNNERGNVHRICHTCHNRWHTLNDEGYVWGSVYPLHDPSACTIEDISRNEVFWNGRKTVKAKD